MVNHNYGRRYTHKTQPVNVVGPNTIEFLCSADKRWKMKQHSRETYESITKTTFVNPDGSIVGVAL